MILLLILPSNNFAAFDKGCPYQVFHVNILFLFKPPMRDQHEAGHMNVGTEYKVSIHYLSETTLLAKWD